MEALFLRILNMSAAASVVILAVLLARLLLRKAPKKWSYALWAVVAFRLICPFSVSSTLSLFAVAPLRPPTEYSTWYRENITTMDFISEPGFSGTSVRNPTPSSGPHLNVTMILTALWLAGVVALLAYSIYQEIRLRRLLSTATRLEQNIYQSEAVRSPFVLGIRHPIIYIPYDLKGRALDYVLAHERHHLRRHDHLIRRLALVLLAVHWFNPLVWLAFYLMGKDMELSCDEGVLEFTCTERAGYSDALLYFATKQNNRDFAAAPLSFGETAVKTRIKNALGWNSPKVWVSALAAGLCLVLIMSAASNPGTQRLTHDFGTLTGVELTESGEQVLFFDCGEKKERAVLVDDLTHLTSSIPELISSDDFQVQPPVNVGISLSYRRLGQQVTMQDGRSQRIYPGVSLEIVEADTGKRFSLSDGTQVELWFHKDFDVYRLSDGTELLGIQRSPSAPVSELSPQVQDKIGLFFRTHTSLNIPQLLEDAYQDYRTAAPGTFRWHTENQGFYEVHALASHVAYCSDSISGTVFPFHRETGELLAIEDLFTCPIQEVVSLILDLDDPWKNSHSDPPTREQLEDAFHPEYLKIYPGQKVCLEYPGLAIPGRQSVFSTDLVPITPELAAMFQPWALPTE